MVTHFYPGDTIPMPLPYNGYHLSWTTVGRTDLETADPARYQFNGYFGLGTVGFTLVGEGKPVDIRAYAQGAYGVALAIYKLTAPNHWERVSTSSGGGDTAAALRYAFNSGETYYFEVGSSGGDAGGNYTQPFTMDLTYAPTTSNDIRANAYDVVIPADGATFTSDPTSFQGYSSNYDGVDDIGPIFGGDRMEYTMWWKYVPTSNCDATFTFTVAPASATWFGIQVYEEDESHQFTRRHRLDSPGSFVGYGLIAGRNYWIQIGDRDTTRQPYSQLMTLQVTGAKSQAQQSADGFPPANDLRQNAIAIPIPTGGRYWISQPVNVKNATRDTGDYGDPWSIRMDQSIWYKWTADVTGECTIVGYHDPDTADPAFNIQVIDQTANDSLTLHFHMDDSPKTFKAVKGHTYYFALGLEGFSGPAGFDGILSMSLKAPALPGPKKPVAAKPPGTSSVLDLIREFQRESHLVVRIINDRTISIVDPDEPVPSGMTAGGSESYYVAAESMLTSSLDELVLKKANLQFDGKVTFRVNDISLLTSGWKIAGRIPFPGSDPVPVSRLHARFTPDGCQIECDLFYDKDVLPPAILKNPLAVAGDETEPS